MANTLLTPSALTREALRILHQKCAFIGSINRQYDDQFAKSGAKIGDTLRIRMPNEYTVRKNSATLSTQDTVETSINLQVATQDGVDLNFTSADLTLSLDDFSSRILEPAMAVLAARLESQALTMAKYVPNFIDNGGSAISFAKLMAGRKAMQDNLAPPNDRSVILNTQDNVDLVDALKGLFHDSTAVKQQYREGMMGRTAGFDFYESTLITPHTTGTAAENDTSYNINGASQTGSVIVVDTGTTTFNAGDVITLAGVYDVHPETKETLSTLKKFVIAPVLSTGYCGNGSGASATSTGTSATNIGIYPSIVTSGGKQNCSASPTTTGAVNKIGAGNAGTYNYSLLYQKDSFTFATADLVMPNGVDFKAREVYDGISMRIVRAYDIANDKFPCRLDVLYGFAPLRGWTACRVHSN